LKGNKYFCDAKRVKVGGSLIEKTTFKVVVVVVKSKILEFWKNVHLNFRRNTLKNEKNEGFKRI